jgi:TetR/AcrR family transcriptional regulator, regulator of cefoperazone and chloramphenicol sensitivity
MLFSITIYKMSSEKKKKNLSRKKIINAAIVLFANKGFELTSTREICKNAGVNLSLIPYYFENKEGLYINIIESILDYGLAFLREDLLKVSKINSMDMDEKVNLYHSLLETYVEFLYSENVPGSFVILMVKEQTVSHSKFSQIYSQKISILYKALRKILASIMGKNENHKDIIFEVSAIIGQILSFKIMDGATLSSLNQDFYTKDDKKRIKNLALYYIDGNIRKMKTQIPASSVLKVVI